MALAVAQTVVPNGRQRPAAVGGGESEHCLLAGMHSGLPQSWWAQYDKGWRLGVSLFAYTYALVNYGNHVEVARSGGRGGALRET